MTVSILADNSPGNYTAAEHGFSCFVEHDGKRLLFDTGQSSLFLENARIMGIDMTAVETIVLSHGHFDHGDGLQYLQGGKLICHPGCFVKRFRIADYSYIGLKNTKEELSARFKLITSATPYHISDKIVFLGEIPRITGFESKRTSFILDNGIPDFVMDDSAIALLLGEGLFVITGCGHAGIVNILEHAKNITGEKRIYGILGGFHLKHADLQIKETIRYLKKNDVVKVFPSHCTDKPALELFHASFGRTMVKTGQKLTF